MAVLLSIQRQKAFLRRGEWTCADSRIERQLNAATGEWFRSAGSSSLASPDPEQVLAAEMARRFNGRVLLRTPANSRINGRIYFSKRQITFDFDAGEP